jgi:hypothetical protein
MNKFERPENSSNKPLKNLIIWALASVAITLAILFSGLLPIRLEMDATQLAQMLDKTGLTSLFSHDADVKVSAKANGVNVVAENKGSQAVDTPVNQDEIALAEHQDTVTLTIPPKQQLIYRLAMERDYDLEYSWNTNGKPVYSEFRGEHKDAKINESKNFGKTTKDKANGFFISPFAGNFGWYWDNKTDQAVTVRLTTKGEYKVIGIIAYPIKG